MSIRLSEYLRGAINEIFRKTIAIIFLILYITAADTPTYRGI